MADPASSIAALVESTLRVAWLSGGATWIGTHTTRWRTLPGAVFVEAIGLRSRVQLAGAPTLPSEPGSAIVIDQGVRHCIDSTEVGVGLSRWGHATFHVLGGISVLSLFDVPVVRPPPRGDLGRLAVELAVFHRSQPPPLERAVRGQLLGMRMLATLIDGCPLNERAAALVANLRRLAPVFAHLDERLDQPASRESLARLAGLSPSRFHELFLAVMRESPMAHLARRRMRRAQRLLLEGGEVQRVAAAVGYADPFHFSRAFKQLCGQSPTRWRQEVARGLVGPS